MILTDERKQKIIESLNTITDENWVEIEMIVDRESRKKQLLQTDVMVSLPKNCVNGYIDKDYCRCFNYCEKCKKAN
jgi:hypothetical protein